MVLFIAQQHKSFFGGGVITDRNLVICQNNFGKENTKLMILPERTPGIWPTAKSFMNGYLLGLTSDIERNIITYLKENPEFKYVFIDNSMLGKLAYSIKKQLPELHIIVFFHNVEIVFFSTFIKTSKRYAHSIGMFSIYSNESKAIRNADSIIALNTRDSEELSTRYGRKADLVLPSSVEDKFLPECIQPVETGAPISLLFVGSRFFANEEGISWFITNVMPSLHNAHLTIVGKGFEDLRSRWENSKITVVGKCEDLAPYYYQADIVIAPIFTGSGMKTKTAEALMYGKTIIGSTEAFEGYEIDKNVVGGEFNKADEYIHFINNFSAQSDTKFNENSRAYFAKLYSINASEKLLKSFLNHRTSH
jgi:hypothetical protein